MAPGPPNLPIAPCSHTSVSFTWRSRRLAPGLRLKIGTQPAFVGERKEGRKVSDKGDSKLHHPGKLGVCAGRAAGRRGRGPYWSQSEGHSKVGGGKSRCHQGQGSNFYFVKRVARWRRWQGNDKPILAVERIPVDLLEPERVKADQPAGMLCAQEGEAFNSRGENTWQEREVEPEG